MKKQMSLKYLFLITAAFLSKNSTNNTHQSSSTLEVGLSAASNLLGVTNKTTAPSVCWEAAAVWS